MERPWSLVDAATAPTGYTVGVKRDANSRGGSAYIHEHLRVGAYVGVAAPRNNFPLAADAGHSVLIAGGIGITPIWCMAKALLAAGRGFELPYAAGHQGIRPGLHSRRRRHL